MRQHTVIPLKVNMENQVENHVWCAQHDFFKCWNERQDHNIAGWKLSSLSLSKLCKWSVNISDNNIHWENLHWNMLVIRKLTDFMKFTVPYFSNTYTWHQLSTTFVWINVCRVVLMFFWYLYKGALYSFYT